MKSTKVTSKTLVYGGTFDPPHLGHRKIVELASKKFNFEKILVVPSFQKIFATEQGTQDFEKRVRLCHLNFQGLHPNLTVSDFEKSMEPPVYTHQLLSHFIENTPSTEPTSYVFLMGDDQIPTLSKWFKFADLCEKTDFLVANRLADNTKQTTARLVEVLNQLQLGPSLDHKTVKLTGINCTFHFLENPIIQISSTQIRNSGYSLQNLHPDVMKAIEENHVDY